MGKTKNKFKEYGFKRIHWNGKWWVGECPECEQTRVACFQGLLFAFTGGGKFICENCNWGRTINELKKEGGYVKYKTSDSNVDYKIYIQSEEWNRIRKLKIAQANYTCERCNKKNVRLEVHHLTYDNLGHENMEDLIAVCRKCHLEMELEKENKKCN
jgi:hypothetical protein